MKAFIALLVVAAATPLAAQSRYPKHNFTIGAGAGLPGGELSGPFSNRPGISVGYGYRVLNYLQVDGGLDTVFGAAGVRAFLPTELGYLRIRDFQWLLPFGGRLVLPVSGGRLLLSGGGGGAYMRYSERLRQPSSYYRFECPDCTSRSGWGNYALASASMALDHYQRFRVGVTAKLYRGHTDGAALGALPAVETLDRWINIFADFTVSF
ncbi:MAG: hypothetical protein ACE141_00045 [Bryobacteraceae bacterium]